MSPFKSCRGSVVTIVLAVLMLIGLFLAVQTMGLVSLGTVSRASDDFRQTVADDQRFAGVVRESVQAVLGVSYQPSEASVEAEIAARLATLNTGFSVGDSRLSALSGTPGTLSAMGMFPDAFAPLGTAPSSLSSLARPEIVQLAGPRVAVSAVATFDFSRGHSVLGAANTWQTRVTAQQVQAPLSRYPVVSYIYPADVLRTGISGATPVLPVLSPLPGGLIPMLNSAAVGDLRSPETLPQFFRARSVMATAYQYVFSSAYLQKLVDAAGFTHCGDLDAAGPALIAPSVPIVNPQLAGITEPVAGQEFILDVGLAGEGRRQAADGRLYTLTKQVVFLFTSSLVSKEVHLIDSVGSGSALMVVLSGGADLAAAPLVVSVDSAITRPIVIVGYNIRLGSLGNRVINGAVLLDPRSSVDSSAGRMSLAHCSYYAFAAGVTANSFDVNQTMPVSAEQLVPRVTYVATGCSRP